MSRKVYPIDSYGGVTTENVHQMAKEIAKAKPEKMELLKSVVAVMEKKGVEYWLDSGTLLGAYRDGQMVPHDFDIDLSVLGEKDLDAAQEILEEIKPEGYSVRRGHHLPNSPTKKVEIYKVFETYNPVDPRTVSMDILMYDYIDDDKDVIRMIYKGFGLENCRYKKGWLFPLENVKFEGMELPVPRDPQAWLTEQYDYLGADCYYDNDINKYRKLPNDD